MTLSMQMPVKAVCSTDWLILMA